MLATVPSATLLGVDGHPVIVEVHVSNGLPTFTIVGLPDTSCRESRDRVRSALLSSHLPWPSRRVTVNLAPSGMRKGGAGLDLPMAIALLVAGEVLLPVHVEGVAFIGELGLDGSIRSVPGVVPLVDAVTEPTVVVAAGCAREASVVGRHRVRTAPSLSSLVDCLRGRQAWAEPPIPSIADDNPREPDLVDVRGQRLGRFAMEVAAAGGHHVLLTGPPGAGKTMLARRLPGLLPPLSPAEALEVTRIHSAAGNSASSSRNRTPR